LHVADEDQLALKVASALPDLPKALAETLAPNEAWVTSPHALDYRHKAIFLPRISRGRLELGGYARRSHEVVPLTHCEVITPALRQVRSQLRTALEPDVLSGTLALRTVILRANQVGEVLATVVVRQAPSGSGLRSQAAALIEGPGPLVGLHLQLHEAEGDAVSGPRPTEHLAGAAALEETVCGRPFRIRPLAFFQVNPPVLEGIVALLRQQLSHRREGEPGSAMGTSPTEPPRLLLDLYCGGGVLGLSSLTGLEGWKLLGIDVSEAGIDDARWNAQRSALEAYDFRSGPVAELLTADALRAAQAAIIDPPRAGLSADVLAALDESGPELILYVACSTRSLARDAEGLLKAGYRADFLCPADMMPQTPYVEWVAGFRRQSQAV
jgi:23S rRNA (uracil1939-C5)-methyltransferase